MKFKSRSFALLSPTGAVEEGEASSGRKQILPSTMMSDRVKDVDKLTELLGAIAELIHEAKSKEAAKKRRSSRKKANEGESELTSANDAEQVETVAKPDSKRLRKFTANINDTEKVLQKLSEIGFKPTLTHGNKVASESYTLLQQGLKGIGNAHYAAVGLSMVAYVLERVTLARHISGKCLPLLDRMYKLGRDMVNAHLYLPENGDLLHSLLTEITKGVYFCCYHAGSGVFSRFAFATVNKEEFDTRRQTMTDLSEEFVRASHVETLKGQKYLHELVQDSHTSLSNQLTQLYNLYQTTNTGYGLPKGVNTEYTNVVVAERTSVFKSEEPTVEKETSGPAARPENFQHLPKHMTDVHIEEEEIVSKLETVTTLGLVGMGGLGKTTLAKAIFNILSPKFDYTCFVSDVKHIKGREDDVKDELWKRLHFQGRKVGGECNWSVSRGKRLLLALDDVSDRDIKVLLELADDADPASRFILTSRERDILKDVGTIHEVSRLSDDHAGLLFMKHAFPETTIPGLELESLVNGVVRKCDGLPLALEVLGKYLRGKEKPEFWEDTLSVLETAGKVKNLDQRLWAKLRLSSNCLGETELEMFLDATNCFCGNWPWTLRKAKMAWRAAYGEVSELSWQTLVDMSLVYEVGEQEEIRVHEQLRSVGRMIASEREHMGKYQVWKCKALNDSSADGKLELVGTSDALNGKVINDNPGTIT